MNRALIGLVAFAVMMAPAMAETLPTGAVYEPGISDAPITTAKWETVPSAGFDLDDDTDKPWTQVMPPMAYGETKSIKYWAVVTDPNGIGDLTDVAYVDVYHSDGTFKYQVKLSELYTATECNSASTKVDDAIADLTAAYNAGLVKFEKNTATGADYTLAEVVALLETCSAKIYAGEEDIQYCQMCGEFVWEQRCDCAGCTPYWYLLDNANGYRVEAYAFDKAGVISAKLVNYFEYICTAGVELDFDRLDFGSVKMSSNKWIEGDSVFNALIGGENPACAVGTTTDCRAPTIRSIGNTRTNIYVEFDDMGFGGSTSGWNVEWDSRLGLDASKIFDPYVNQDVGELDLCGTKRISFSIHVKKATETGAHTGTVTITPEAVAFP